jgi:alpha-glucosidase
MADPWSLAILSPPYDALSFSIGAISSTGQRVAILYFLCFFGYLLYRNCRVRSKQSSMARSPLIIINVFIFVLWSAVFAQSPLSAANVQVSADRTSTSPRPIFTVPSSADQGEHLLPNIYDTEAVSAQDVCPGYKASNVIRTAHGMTADLTLAGKACNVYGTDVENLRLTVEYQSSDRLHVEITPTYIGPSNSSWFILPEGLVPKPTIDIGGAVDSDLEFVYSNEPTFSFAVLRQSTGDVLFTSNGTKLVFENQFIEFASSLPENYNLYGLGEVIHGLRMGNNFTRTFYAADVGDPPDTNLYGSHPFYLDTRYFQINQATGEQTYVANATDRTAEYISYSHGVFLRNAHGQEVLMTPSNLTWRLLGGNIDLYFYAGPTQKEVTKAYQLSTIGLPVMQQYFTFGYHQCRWGYKNWTQLQGVVDDFARFGLPLDNIWTDIDYMNQYRDFENDMNTFSYAEGEEFLAKLHANGQHYIPIIDSAVYIPNPTNESDAYPTFTRGNKTDSFMRNPDGSLYIGTVWPGYTVFPDWVGAALSGGGAFKWWTDEVTMYHQNISFDGIWIDMNGKFPDYVFEVY